MQGRATFQTPAFLCAPRVWVSPCICWLEVDIVSGIWDSCRIKHHTVLTKLHLTGMSELCLKI